MKEGECFFVYKKRVSMMKNMTRIVALLLAVIMCGAIVACGKSGDETATTTAQNAEATTAATESGTVEDADTGAMLDLPAELNYNGDTVSVLHWDSEKPEFGVEEITGANDE